MKKRIAFMIIFLVFCVMIGTTLNAKTVDRVIAIVGTDVITLYDLDRAMVSHLDEIKRSPNKDNRFKEVKRSVLQSLVDDLLLKQAVDESDIDVTVEDIARAVQNILAQNQITIEMLKEELRGKGISYESYKEDLKGQIRKFKFINREIGSKISISDSDLRDYYEGHMSEFGHLQSIHMAQIVLPFKEDETKESAEQLMKKAKEIAAKAKSGTPFESLAKKYSKGPNAAKGGDLGVISPKMLLPEVANKIAEMKPGRISDPIVSQAGIHIIYLMERASASITDFDSIKEEIHNRLFDIRLGQEIDRYLNDARRRIYVEIKN